LKRWEKKLYLQTNTRQYFDMPRPKYRLLDVVTWEGDSFRDPRPAPIYSGIIVQCYGYRVRKGRTERIQAYQVFWREANKTTDVFEKAIRTVQDTLCKEEGLTHDNKWVRLAAKRKREG
jgi:hypothetical protein